MKLSEVLQKVISLSEEIDAYWSEELPKRFPDYPFLNGKEEPSPPPQVQQLKEFMDSLDPELIYRMILVMFLGRGDFGVDDLNKEYSDIKTKFEKPEYASRQMEGKAVLAEYLTDGLAILQDAGIDVDELGALNFQSVVR